MPNANRYAALLAGILLGATLAPAATVTGSVKGPDGAPFKGAFVEAQNSATRITVNVLTDPDGRYRISNLPAGDYELRIRAIGYKADPRPGLKLAASEKTSADFA